MPRKTYVQRTTMEVLGEVDDHRDVNFPNAEWSREPAGLAALQTSAVPSRYWVFDPPGGDSLRAMTTAERNALDSDPAQLAAARKARRAELFAEITKFIEGRYSDRTRAALVELRAAAPGAPVLDGYFNWVRRVWVGYRTAVTAVNSATNVVAVQSTTLDFAALASTDPQIEIDQIAT
jgi:hypothetical protein